MKKHLVYLSLLITGVACQPDSVKESMTTDDQITGNQASVVVNKRLFTEVPISTVGICQAGDARNCGETVSQLRQQLIKLDPLPVPDYGKETTINWQQADKAYRQFVAAHKDQPITSLFQQLYARILINQYGLGQSDNYEQTAYYLNQMVISHSLDLSTMTQTIDQMQGHISESEYTQKLGAIIQIAQQQQEYNTQLVASLQKSVANARTGKFTGDLNPDFMVEAHKRMISQAKNSDVSTHLNRLHAIQKSLRVSIN